MINIDENIFLSFRQAINEAAEDGLVLDILINNTDTAHWEEFLSFIKQNHGYFFWTVDDAVTKDLPKDIRSFFEEEQSGFLEIRLSQLTIQCLGAKVEIIDMFIKPEQLNSEDEIKGLLSFLYGVANTIKMDVGIHLEAAVNSFITITSSGDIQLT